MARMAALYARYICRNERWIALALIAVAIALRVLWIVIGDRLVPPGPGDESNNVALSLARTGLFGDPFGVPTGATAHLGMLTPWPTAAAYMLFGVDSHAAEVALAAWAIGLTALSFWLCWLLTRELGAPVWGRLTALAIVAIFPFQFSLETRDATRWEMVLATCLLLNLLRLVAKYHDDQPLRGRTLAIMGALAGVTAIVSPPAGLASVAAIGVLCLMRVSWRRWIIPAAAFLVIFVPPTLAWQQRNLAQLGQPIALRDNLGLELALANYPGAAQVTDQKVSYTARLLEIHPTRHGPGLTRVKEIGEVAYYDELRRESFAWIAAYPADAARLSARHVREYLLTSPWMWQAFGDHGSFIALRSALLSLFSVVALASLAVLAVRLPRYRPVAIAIFCCLLPYILVQPMLRYRYLVSSLLIFLALDGGSRVIEHFARKNVGSRTVAT